MSTVTASNELDALCLTVMGQDFQRVEASLKSGYVPTLRPHSGRDKGTKAYNAAVAALVVALKAKGYRVWEGRN